MRVVHFFYYSDHLSADKGIGYLWNPIAPFFETPLYSLIGSSVCVLIIAILINYINEKYVLIRKKTLLPSAIVILALSITPEQMVMSPAYIGVLTMLFVIASLFDAYNSGDAQRVIFLSSFYLGLGSLFEPFLLIYIPVLWICLLRLKSFGIKTLFASVFGLVVVLFPAFSFFFLIKGDANQFVEPLMLFKDFDLMQAPILNYSLFSYLILGVIVVLTFIVLLDNSINSFKNKVKVRIFLAVLSILSIFSMLSVLILNVDTELFLYIALAIGSVLLGHFFALTSHKLIPYTFYILLFFILVVSFYPK